jgi:hypothetical protein
MLPMKLSRSLTCVFLVSVLFGAANCSSAARTGSDNGTASGARQIPASGFPEPPIPHYSIAALLRPAHKYFGVALPGAPDSTAPLTAYSRMVGKSPNLLEFYSAWGDGFDSAGAAKAWQAGAVPLMAWEPKTVSVSRIASGAEDAYIHQEAAAISRLGTPLAVSFGHEMNGDWEPWGTGKATPAEFVAAWRHIHDLFRQDGVDNVIWVWSPNATNIAKSPLRPLWPGDTYVDWIGVIGYYGQSNDRTFAKLFGPTIDEVRGFTAKPVVIAETAAGPDHNKPAEMVDLFHAIASRSDVIGFIWFDFDKPGQYETDWRVDSSNSSLAAFKSASADPRFGFDPRVESQR